MYANRSRDVLDGLSATTEVHWFLSILGGITMGTIYQAIIAEHCECLREGMRTPEGSLRCVVTPDDELACAVCGKTIKV